MVLDASTQAEGQLGATLSRSAVLPLMLLSLMTYVVMPVVTRLLGRWLYPSGP
jgi:antibiotic biosynthesis monooxygenase (ABM) superfamily enzyme